MMNCMKNNLCTDVLKAVFVLSVTSFSFESLPVRAAAKPPAGSETYWRITQGGGAIIVDPSGYWWDMEVRRGPSIYTKMHKLPIKIVGKTKIVRLGDKFYCTKGQWSSRSYLYCTANGWVFDNNSD